MKDSRLQALRALLNEKGLDAVIITKYVNLHYFSGFRGDDTTLVIGKNDAMLITDSRYTEQAGQQAPLFEIVEQKDGLLSKTAECVKKIGAKKVGFEGNAIIYDYYVFIKIGVYDKRMHFNPVKYCEKVYGHNNDDFSKQNEIIHDALMRGDYSDKKSVLGLFKKVDETATSLNHKVTSDMNDIEIKIAAAQRSLI